MRRLENKHLLHHHTTHHWRVLNWMDNGVVIWKAKNTEPEGSFWFLRSQCDTLNDLVWYRQIIFLFKGNIVPYSSLRFKDVDKLIWSTSFPICSNLWAADTIFYCRQTSSSLTQDNTFFLVTSFPKLNYSIVPSKYHDF